MDSTSNSTDAPGLSGSEKDMSSLHWMPWYPNRWLGSMSVKCMTMEERAAYREMLDWQWQGQGYLPEDIETLSRCVGFDVNKYPQVLAKFPISSNGKRANSVLLQIWQDQLKKHSKHVDSAHKRWKKEETDTDTESNADARHDAKHDATFDVFWSAYPRRIGKKAALKAWNAAKDKPNLQQIIAAVESQMRGEQWMKDGGKFIPHPSTWLNQGRWADESTTVSSVGIQGKDWN